MLTRLVTAEGSTRPAALMRIGLPLLIWSRLAGDFLLFKDLHPHRIALSVVFFLSTSAMLVGWHSRLSSAATGAVMMALYYGVGVVGGEESYTHHHIYLLAIAPLLLSLTACGRSCSWDRWRAVQAGAAPPERGPTWGMVLITVQLSQIYLWGAYSKCHWGYLSGARLEQQLMYLYLGSDYPDWALFGPLMAALAVGSVVIEVVLGVGLFFRRTHRWLIPMGIAFHALLYWTLPVATFSATMWLLYLAAIDPDAIHRVLDEISGTPPPDRTNA